MRNQKWKINGYVAPPPLPPSPLLTPNLLKFNNKDTRTTSIWKIIYLKETNILIVNQSSGTLFLNSHSWWICLLSFYQESVIISSRFVLAVWQNIDIVLFLSQLLNGCYRWLIMIHEVLTHTISQSHEIIGLTRVLSILAPSWWCSKGVSWKKPLLLNKCNESNSGSWPYLHFCKFYNLFLINVLVKDWLLK